MLKIVKGEEQTTSQHFKSKEAEISSGPNPRVLVSVLRVPDTSSGEIDNWDGKKENCWILILFIRAGLGADGGL